MGRSSVPRTARGVSVATHPDMGSLMGCGGTDRADRVAGAGARTGLRHHRECPPHLGGAGRLRAHLLAARRRPRPRGGDAVPSGHRHNAPAGPPGRPASRRPAGFGVPGHRTARGPGVRQARRPAEDARQGVLRRRGRQAALVLGDRRAVHASQPRRNGGTLCIRPGIGQAAPPVDLHPRPPARQVPVRDLPRQAGLHPPRLRQVPGRGPGLRLRRRVRRARASRRGRPGEPGPVRRLHRRHRLPGEDRRDHPVRGRHAHPHRTAR